MNNKIKLSIAFLILGIFSSQVSDLLCWLWLDEMECYLQTFCDIYDKLEYIIAHEILAMLFYFVGLYGFVGSILYYLESKYLGGWFKKIIEACGSVFGWVLTTVVSTITMTYLSNLLGLHKLFDILYNLVNN